MKFILLQNDVAIPFLCPIVGGLVLLAGGCGYFRKPIITIINRVDWWTRKLPLIIGRAENRGKGGGGCKTLSAQQENTGVVSRNRNKLNES